ncbi:asparaginase domain-containing protein [Paracoccus beibuensis]|uniref:asparaginase domain-containing protein n=1 Tax=Paracoccus beibuensis TaxID=547602 RepID=UPI00223F5271|nr:asparaginase domain-containing protein [Paracoccus beibuensis]
MRICVINTGGTIASVGQPLAPMSAERFAAAVTGLLGASLAAALPDDRLHIDTGLRFPGGGLLDSTDLRPSDWCRIARRVLELYADHDAFVILHGTDTMDFTGAALPLLLNVFDAMGLARAALSKPVILTGSQLPLFRDTPEGLVLNAGSDGFANLAGALHCARLRLPEVAVFFGGQLLRGSRALKVSTTRFAGFDSPHLPPLAEVGIGIRHGTSPLPGPAAPELSLNHPAAHALALAQLDAVQACIDSQRIAQIPAMPADHGAAQPLLARMVRDALEGGATGLLLEGFGEGNIPAGNGAMQAALKGAQVPVLIASRAIDGQVGAFHYAAGAWIGATGAIAAGDMTPVAALAKLMILNTAAGYQGWDRMALRALLTRSLTGECAASDRLTGTLLPGQRLLAADGDATLMNDPDAGPRLVAGGQVLWQAPAPGRLLMQGNRLALVSPDGAVAWTSAPGAPGAVPVLTAAPPALLLVDPAGRTAPVTALAG